MTGRYPGALLVSLTVHGAIAMLILLFGYAASLSKPDSLMDVELVGSYGGNDGANVSPGLGDTALKMNIPKASTHRDPTPEPALPPPATTEKTSLRISKEAFDKAHAGQKQSPVPTRASRPNIVRIDTNGIREGMVGGPTKNEQGSTSGTTLAHDNKMDAYFGSLKEKLQRALEKPPGLSESLVTWIDLRINPDGSLIGWITKSSGSDEFDAAVMAAVHATRMPPHPEKKSETFPVPFRMTDERPR